MESARVLSGDLTDGTSDNIKIEFAINFNNQDDLTGINKILQSEGFTLVSSNLKDKTIQVQRNFHNESTTLSHIDIQSLQKHIEQQTGFLVVIKGLGNLRAAVAELSSPQLSENHAFGVVRLSQLTDESCYVDGSVDGHIKPSDNMGLSPENNSKYPSQTDLQCEFTIAIHEFGDLSSSTFDTIGESVLILTCSVHELGQDGRFSVSFQRVIPNCDIRKMIGKSVALSVKGVKTIADGSILSAAVLARASEVSTNEKKFCACSGRTLWQERQENL